MPLWALRTLSPPSEDVDPEGYGAGTPWGARWLLCGTWAPVTITGSLARALTMGPLPKADRACALTPIGAAAAAPQATATSANVVTAPRRRARRSMCVPLAPRRVDGALFRWRLIPRTPEGRRILQVDAS